MIENHIHKQLLEIKDDLELFDNDLDKYEYIIDLGKNLEPFDTDDQKEENLVQGCTSKVWLICEPKENKLYFKANSNAQIVKGLVYIIISLFSNLSAKEILKTNSDILEELNLSEIITPNRQSGVRGMLKRIKEYAHAFREVSK